MISFCRWWRRARNRFVKFGSIRSAKIPSRTNMLMVVKRSPTSSQKTLRGSAKNWRINYRVSTTHSLSRVTWPVRVLQTRQEAWWCSARWLRLICKIKCRKRRVTWSSWLTRRTIQYAFRIMTLQRYQRWARFHPLSDGILCLRRHQHL